MAISVFLSSIVLKCFIIFVAMFCMAVLFYLQKTSDLYKRVESQSDAILDLNTLPNVEQSTTIDCEHETVYSISDQQCRIVCDNSTAHYVEHNGMCVDSRVLNYSSAANNECDPAKGVLGYMLGDGQLGTSYVHCLSVDMGVQPDDPKKRNMIVKNAVDFTVDYNKGFPDWRDTNITCFNGDVKSSIPNTMNVRERAVCVPSAWASILEFE